MVLSKYKKSDAKCNNPPFSAFILILFTQLLEKKPFFVNQYEGNLKKMYIGCLCYHRCPYLTKELLCCTYPIISITVKMFYPHWFTL